MEHFGKKPEKQQKKQVGAKKRKNDAQNVPKRRKAKEFGIGIKKEEEKSCHCDAEWQINIKTMKCLPVV